jgi:hypothetical protein
MALTTAFVAAVRRQGSIPSNVPRLTSSLSPTRRFRAPSSRSSICARTSSCAPSTSSADARGNSAPAQGHRAALRSVQLYTGNGWFPLPQRDLADDDYISAARCPTRSRRRRQHRPASDWQHAAPCACATPPGRARCASTRTNLAKALTAVSAPGATTTAITAAFTGSLASCDIVSSGPAHQQKAIGAALGGVTAEPHRHQHRSARAAHRRRLRRAGRSLALRADS